MLGKPDIARVLIGVQRQDRDRVVLALGRAGLVHLAAEEDAASRGSAAWRAELAGQEQQIRGLYALAGGLLVDLGEQTPPGAADPAGRDFSADAAFAAAAQKKLERCEALRQTLRSRIELDSRRLGYAGLTAAAQAPGPGLCCLLPGTVPPDFVRPPPDPAMPLILRRSGCCALAIALERQRDQALAALAGRGFHPDSALAAPGGGLPRRGTIERRIASLRRRNRALAAWRKHRKVAWRARLIAMHGACSGQLQALAAAKTLCVTDEAAFVRGWIEARNAGRIRSLLGELCGRRFALIVSASRAQQTPVLLHNNGLFRPFELLVRTIGMPAHLELDPTPLTALSYMLLFGVMFGDAGQGLVIALAGRTLQRAASSRAGPESFAAQLGGILWPCGLSAALFGLLYGSCFSSELLLPALWFRPMEHIDRLFTAAIAMGVVFMASGCILNIANRLARGDLTEALFGRCGAAGFACYAGAVLLCLRYFAGGGPPGPAGLIICLCLPAALYAGRDLLGPLLLRRGRPAGRSLPEQLIEVPVELLDLATGFFANTVSFIRAGAFALSHAGLSIATYSLAAMIDPRLTGAGALAIIVLGNIVIIALEGLICAIQSMRLEYYEFYGKFYRGDGVAFRPFVLQPERP